MISHESSNHLGHYYNESLGSGVLNAASLFFIVYYLFIIY